MVRSLGAALSLALAFSMSACSGGPAADDGTPPTQTDPTTGPADGIGTSPSPPSGDPNDDKDPNKGSHKRRATENDPTGCPTGMWVVVGTTGNDVFDSSEANTCFVGLGGADVVFARGQNDFVIVGAKAYVAAQPDTIVLGTSDVVRGLE